MLVLSRKAEERIILTVGGIEISLVVVDIRGDKARLGIDAPASVIIDRQEVHEAKLREKAKA